MATDALPETLSFLTDAAHLLATTSPEISAHLMTQRNALMFHHDLPQSDIQRQHVCGCCGHIMIPGQGSTLKLETDRVLRKRKAPRKETAKGPATRPETASAQKTQKTRKRLQCKMCRRSTTIAIPPAAPISRHCPKLPVKTSAVQGPKGSISSDAPASQAEPTSSEPLKAPSANASSKKRAKSRKQGLQALLQKSQSSTPTAQGGLGLSLSDFLKK